MSEKSKLLTESHDRIIEWIKFADAKAAVVATICAVYLGFSKSIAVKYINILDESFTKQQHSSIKLAISTVLVAGLFYFLMRTLFYILRAVRATTKNPDYNPLFFGHIAQKSYTEFSRIIRRRTVAQLNEDILKQAHTNSAIATKKYRYVNEAILSIIVATPFLVAAGAYLATL